MSILSSNPFFRKQGLIITPVFPPEQVNWFLKLMNYIL